MSPTNSESPRPSRWVRWTLAALFAALTAVLLFVALTILAFGWAWPPSAVVEVLGIIVSYVVAVVFYVLKAPKAGRAHPK